MLLVNKVCPKCNKEKGLSDFYQQKDGKLYSYCKVCELSKQKKMRNSRPAEYKRKDKNKRLKKEYGIDILQYEEMEKKQNYRCAICNRQRGGSKFDLHIDHCHLTGKIRGLLCQSCNMGLGNFKDDPFRLSSAIRYLTNEENTT